MLQQDPRAEILEPRKIENDSGSPSLGSAKFVLHISILIERYIGGGCYPAWGERRNRHSVRSIVQRPFKWWCNRPTRAHSYTHTAHPPEAARNLFSGCVSINNWSNGGRRYTSNALIKNVTDRHSLHVHRGLKSIRLRTRVAQFPGTLSLHTTSEQQN